MYGYKKVKEAQNDFGFSEYDTRYSRYTNKVTLWVSEIALFMETSVELCEIG